MNRKIFSLILSFLLLTTSPALAAYKATLIGETNLYKDSSANSEVITQLEAGTEVDAGNSPKDGMVKVRTPDHTLGWVSVKKLRAKGAPKSEARSNRESKGGSIERGFEVRAMGGYNL